jgi:hypothetical protein
VDLSKSASELHYIVELGREQVSPDEIRFRDSVIRAFFFGYVRNLGTANCRPESRNGKNHGI